MHLKILWDIKTINCKKIIFSPNNKSWLIWLQDNYDRNQYTIIYNYMKM